MDISCSARTAGPNALESSQAVGAAVASTATQRQSATDQVDRWSDSIELAMSMISVEVPSTIFPTYRERCKDYLSWVWRRARFGSSVVKRRLASSIRKICRVQNSDTTDSCSSISVKSSYMHPESPPLSLSEDYRPMNEIEAAAVIPRSVNAGGPIMPRPSYMDRIEEQMRAAGLLNDSEDKWSDETTDEIAAYTQTLYSQSSQPGERDSLERDSLEPELESPVPEEPRPVNPQLRLPTFLRSKSDFQVAEEEEEQQVTYAVWEH